MKASIVELRTKMGDITKALYRHETVTIFSHGKPIGYLQPLSAPKSQSKNKKKLKVKDHPFFGLTSKSSESVDEVMIKLRRGRY